MEEREREEMRREKERGRGFAVKRKIFKEAYACHNWLRVNVK